MQKPLTRVELDRAQCATPGCTHEDHSELFLHARCHMNAGLQVSYSLVTGTLKIACLTCDTPIAVVAVAAGEP